MYSTVEDAVKMVVANKTDLVGGRENFGQLLLGAAASSARG